MITVAWLLGLNWLLGSVFCYFADWVFFMRLPEKPSKAEERACDMWFKLSVLLGLSGILLEVLVSLVS